MNHHIDIVRVGKIAKHLVTRPYLLPEDIHADDGSYLGSEVLSQPDEVDSSLRRFEDPPGFLDLYRHPPVCKEHSRRIIGDEIDERLLHAAEHAVAVDDVAEAAGTVDGVPLVPHAL